MTSYMMIVAQQNHSVYLYSPHFIHVTWFIYGSFESQENCRLENQPTTWAQWLQSTHGNFRFTNRQAANVEGKQGNLGLWNITIWPEWNDYPPGNQHIPNPRYVWVDLFLFLVRWDMWFPGLLNRGDVRLSVILPFKFDVVTSLGIGFKYVYVHPWVKTIPTWLCFFLIGLVQPPTKKLFHDWSTYPPEIRPYYCFSGLVNHWFPLVGRPY